MISSQKCSPLMTLSSQLISSDQLGFLSPILTGELRNGLAHRASFSAVRAVVVVSVCACVCVMGDLEGGSKTRFFSLINASATPPAYVFA